MPQFILEFNSALRMFSLIIEHGDKTDKKANGLLEQLIFSNGMCLECICDGFSLVSDM